MIDDYIKLSSRPDVILFDEIDSTNNYAKRIIASGDAPKLPHFAVVSDMQTAGRGRFGRSFLSPAGSGIYLTYVFRSNLDDSELFKVTPVAASVAHKVVSKYSSSPAKIKWVNDLYNDSGKISGTLTELVEGPDGTYVVIGIGFNCFEVPGLDRIPGMGFITIADDASYSRDEMTCELIDAFGQAFCSGTGKLPDCLDYYREHCFIIGKTVTVKPVSGEPYEAIVTGVNESYELIVSPSSGSGEVVLNSGEVSISV